VGVEVAVRAVRLVYLGPECRLQQDAAFRGKLAASGYSACRDRWSEEVVISRFVALVSERLSRSGQKRAAAQPRQAAR
jgi:hypothetical protein